MTWQGIAGRRNVLVCIVSEQNRLVRMDIYYQAELVPAEIGNKLFSEVRICRKMVYGISFRHYGIMDNSHGF